MFRALLAHLQEVLYKSQLAALELEWNRVPLQSW
jgi:hypothetical protein